MKPPRLPNADGDWRCTICGLWRPRGFFTPNNHALAAGSWCRSCAAAKAQERANASRRGANQSFPSNEYIVVTTRMQDHAKATGQSFAVCMMAAMELYLEREQSKVHAP